MTEIKRQITDLMIGEDFWSELETGIKNPDVNLLREYSDLSQMMGVSRFLGVTGTAALTLGGLSAKFLHSRSKGSVIDKTLLISALGLSVFGTGLVAISAGGELIGERMNNVIRAEAVRRAEERKK